MRVYPPSILPNLTLDSTSLSEVEQVYAISVEKDLTITLIDVRDPKEYNGTLFSANAVWRPGNICNSVNVPLSEMMTADRRFMNSTEILKLLLSKNIDLSTKFITYSNSGIIASDAYVIFKLILKQQVSVSISPKIFILLWVFDRRFIEILMCNIGIWWIMETIRMCFQNSRMRTSITTYNFDWLYKRNVSITKHFVLLKFS